MTEAAGFEAPGLHVVQLEGGLAMAGSPISYTTCPFPTVSIQFTSFLILQLKAEDAKSSKSGTKQLIATRDFNAGDTVFAVYSHMRLSLTLGGCSSSCFQRRVGLYCL